ncbi:DUF4252 domain-containing protein [Mangrovimonas aestuarii]|uniref:DUF4252 domain-containing protein n=1 Tax=Mangrovimonas aestuarii TaxID=3018443 RepID=UPI0023788ACA|nr:DUF4252 domain-containing protein [Mangrovimonas aestuarii]
MKTIKNTFLALFVAMIVFSCNSGPTLQTYFVDHQETPDFTSADIPTNIVKFDTASLSDRQLNAYNSVERLNFLGFKVSETNKELYNKELDKIKVILEDKRYNDLIEFNDRGKKVVVKYIGDNDAADELIVFGSSADLGFGIVRVLGDDMKPSDMASLVKALDHADVDGEQLQSIADFFKQ